MYLPRNMDKSKRKAGSEMPIGSEKFFRKDCPSSIFAYLQVNLLYSNQLNWPTSSWILQAQADTQLNVEHPRKPRLNEYEIADFVGSLFYDYDSCCHFPAIRKQKSIKNSL